MVDEIEEQRFWEEARRSLAAAKVDPEIRKEMEEEQRIYDGALMDGLERETWPDKYQYCRVKYGTPILTRFWDTIKAGSGQRLWWRRINSTNCPTTFVSWRLSPKVSAERCSKSNSVHRKVGSR